jgi:hypothetical protein
MGVPAGTNQSESSSGAPLVFNGTFTFKKSNCEKKSCGGRLSFKTQLKIEYLLQYTSSRKVVENIPARPHIIS